MSNEPPMTSHVLTALDAARDQLDWAIRLLIDHRALISALTLAGAAEEMLGKQRQDGTALRQLAESLAATTGVPVRTLINEHLNGPKNWFKHGSDAPSQEIELQGHVVMMIVRAGINLKALGVPNTAEMTRFEVWLPQERPDLTDDN